MSDELTRGERGPHGDHGQAGDQGITGPVGERGPHGDRGQSGDRGLAGPAGPPGQDWQWGGWPALRALAFVMVALLAAWGNYQAYSVADDARQAVQTSTRESIERRDQICLSAEREHLGNVIALRRTYDYLEALTPEEEKSTLNRFIVTGIGRTEEEAKTDQAPKFCDEPNIGLPEPDPVVPDRPKKVDDLLKAESAR